MNLTNQAFPSFLSNFLEFTFGEVLNYFEKMAPHKYSNHLTIQWCLFYATLRFILTGGQATDVTQADTLIEGVQATYALMDKAYDADQLIEQLKQQNIIPVIPPKSNRKEPREYDEYIYKEGCVPPFTSAKIRPILKCL